MNPCNKWNTRFPEAFYEELSEKEKQAFHSHLSECAECREAYAKLQATLSVMDKRERPELTPDYWEQYWEKLEQNLTTQRSKSKGFLQTWKEKRFDFQFNRRWAFQFAGAVALILIGIFIGRYFNGNQSEQFTKNDRTPSNLNVELTSRTADYLQKSKILLLGLVNFDPEQDDPYAIDFPQKKLISRELIGEANFLKANLQPHQQTQLYDLISDLEVILMQIANLESEYDLSAVELVKSGVERKGIFLKINIEEMRENRSAGQHSSKNKKKNTTI